MSGLCAVMFDTANGTGVCESFLGGEPHRHAGVVIVGLFMCHRCRRAISECRGHESVGASVGDTGEAQR